MDLNKKEKIILVGKSGSGKDYLMRQLVKKGLKPGLKCTTRPQRLKELQGVSYNFITEELFNQYIKQNKFLCHQNFTVTPKEGGPQSWHYGITNDEFESSQVFIMTPEDFKNIEPHRRKECFVVYLDIERSVRESRLIGRHDRNDSVKRRLDSDEIDFIGFQDYDLRITCPDFDVEDIYGLME